MVERRQVVERRQQHRPEVDEDGVMVPVSRHVTLSRGRGRKSHGVCLMDTAARRFKRLIEAMCPCRPLRVGRGWWAGERAQAQASQGRSCGSACPGWHRGQVAAA